MSLYISLNTLCLRVDLQTIVKPVTFRATLGLILDYQLTLACVSADRHLCLQNNFHFCLHVGRS